MRSSQLVLHDDDVLHKRHEHRHVRFVRSHGQLLIQRSHVQHILGQRSLGQRILGRHNSRDKQQQRRWLKRKRWTVKESIVRSRFSYPRLSSLVPVPEHNNCLTFRNPELWEFHFIENEKCILGSSVMQRSLNNIFIHVIFLSMFLMWNKFTFIRFFSFLHVSYSSCGLFMHQICFSLCILHFYTWLFNEISSGV